MLVDGTDLDDARPGSCFVTGESMGAGGNDSTHMHPLNQVLSSGDFGPEPFVVNIARAAERNPFYRKTLWTGHHLQLTLMCIPPWGEVGLEVHPDHD